MIIDWRKSIKKIFAGLFLLTTAVPAQYNLKCDYLINPENAILYADSCAKFWFKSYDTTYGGFFENVTRDGTPSGTTKTMLGQSRTAYAMARAFMLTGDSTYLSYARGALDFMYENAWDSVNTGWYNEMNQKGEINPTGQENNRKWSFMQHYALLGICAMVDATHNEVDKEILLKGRKTLDENLWDSRQGFEGYYNEANIDWQNPGGKGFTPTMDGITTHALNMYLLTGSDEYKQRLIKMADNVIDYIYPAMSEFNYGYPEEYTSDWAPVLSNTYVFTGHMLKSAWCLTRAYLIEPKQEYIDFSNTILEEVLAKGYDSQYGGCYKEYNGETGTRYDNNKEWWELEQMFTSGIMNYYLTKDERFLQMADESMEFYKKYFVDHQYGEVYQTTNRTGSPTTTQKASYWKAGYHSIELGYYVYLYTNLYLHKNPVHLYYKIDASDSAKALMLYPLAIEDSCLKITNVTLNEEEYTDFLSDKRVLNIPQNIGGIFKVTFENIVPVDVEHTLQANITGFELKQNYPNPFNPSTVIKYSIPSGLNNTMVVLKVFDVMGREVSTLVNKPKSSGMHQVTFDASEISGGLSSGVYIYQLKAGSFTEAKKLLILK